MKRCLALIITVLSAVVFCSCTTINNNYYQQNGAAVNSEPAENSEAAAKSEAATESKPVEEKPDVSSAPEIDTPQSTSKTDAATYDYNTPFYGIWVYASKSQDDAEEYSHTVSSNGFNAYVEVTTDWNNLNTEKWYVVTAGKYASENEAQNKLDDIKAYYPDAYVKYSGEYNKANGYQQPFYGIWVSASKNYDEAMKTADEVSSNGFDGFVEDTTKWSNLNSEKWYVVTAGRYTSENDAKNKLAEVQKYYPEAYIKYSGEYGND